MSGEADMSMSREERRVYAYAWKLHGQSHDGAGEGEPCEECVERVRAGARPEITEERRSQVRMLIAEKRREWLAAQRGPED